MALGGTGYQVSDGAGASCQLAVLPALQSRGRGTSLTRASEERIREYGLRRAASPRRRGEQPSGSFPLQAPGLHRDGREPGCLGRGRPDRSIRHHETVCGVHAKEAANPRPAGDACEGGQDPLPPTAFERREAFSGWLHTCGHRRGHTAFKGQPPASRVPNLTGQYN